MKNQQTPSFVKVIVGDFAGKLRIPDSFVRRYGQSLSGKVVLTSQSGNPAVVSVTRNARGCYYFDHGWAAFVEDNGVEEGDHLTFSFIGLKTVVVVFYDSSGCIKGGEDGIHSIEESFAGSGGTDEGSEPSEATETVQACESREAKEKGPAVKRARLGFHSSSAASGKARGLAGLSSFDIAYKKYMKYSVPIPPGFSTTAGLSAGKMINLRDLKGRDWPVNVTAGVAGTGHLRFTAGFKDFRKASGLRVGDWMEFGFEAELGSIRVTISKKNDGGKKVVMNDGVDWERAIVID